MNVFYMIGSVCSVLGVILMVYYNRKDAKSPNHSDGSHKRS